MNIKNIFKKRDHNIKTAHIVELIDALVEQPPNGMRVQALTRGNILVSAIWNSDSINTFDAWMYHPKIPLSVKNRQIQRYTKEML